jgi:hypothetical protein
MDCCFIGPLHTLAIAHNTRANVGASQYSSLAISLPSFEFRKRKCRTRCVRSIANPNHIVFHISRLMLIKAMPERSEGFFGRNRAGFRNLNCVISYLVYRGPNHPDRGCSVSFTWILISYINYLPIWRRWYDKQALHHCRMR